jgi:hypothetical protein
MKCPLTFYTNRFLPSWAGGRAIGPIIILRPKYKGTDEGIYQHEVQHVKHWWLFSIVWCSILYFIHPVLAPAGIGMYGLLYLLIPEFRLWVEVDCYKKQAKYYSDDRVPRFAKAVAEKYNLNITAENVEKLMREP